MKRSQREAQATGGDWKGLEGVMAAALLDPESFSGEEDLAKALGLTRPRTRALFQQHAQRTPETFLKQAHVRSACEAMADGRPGLETPACFERLTGLKPLAFKAMLEMSGFSLPLPSGYRREDLLAYQGRDALSVSERVEDHTLFKAFLVEGSARVLRLQLQRSQVQVSLDPAEPPGPAAMLKVHGMARRLLGLDQHPEGLEANPSHHRLVAGREGLRVPLSLDPFEALVWAILGQQVNLAFAYALRRDLIRTYGVRAPGGLIAHPTPQSLAVFDPEVFKPLRFSRRKAEYLVLAARRVADGTLNLDGFLTATSAERALLALRGCGPWTAAYTLMRGLGFPDCVPVGDAGLTLALQRFFKLEARPGPIETLELMKPFAPYRSLATYHLWTSLKGVPA